MRKERKIHVRIDSNGRVAGIPEFFDGLYYDGKTTVTFTIDGHYRKMFSAMKDTIERIECVYMSGDKYNDE